VDTSKLIKISTEELIKELESRAEIQVFKSTLYSGYNVEIVKKYDENRTPIKLPGNNVVLVTGDYLLNKD
jgi:hypothetical protein